MPDSRRLLELALKGLEVERATIDDEIAQVKGQLNPRQVVADEAMKRRYAEMNRAGEYSDVSQVRTSALVSPKQSTVKKQNGGDRLTAAGRKKLSDLMKKRWEEKRRGKKVKQKK